MAQGAITVITIVAILMSRPFTACGAGPVRVGVPSPSASYFPLIVAAKKSFYAQDALQPELIMIGRPVKLAFGADETFRTICQPRAKITIKTGIEKDGTFVARHCEVYLNGGAYANSGPSVTEKAGYRAHAGRCAGAGGVKWQRLAILKRLLTYF